MRTFILSLVIITLGCCDEIFAQEKLRADGEIPIVAWVGVPQEQISVERFAELKESGINTNMSFYSDLATVEKALDAAQKAGVKIIANCPDLKSDTEKAVRQLMKHPALAGYYLKDEPGADEFSELGAWTKKIQAIDAKHYCYINLFPNYANLQQLFGADAKPMPDKDIYAEHVAAYIREVPVPFVSFDHYCVIQTDGKRYLRPEWYKNLEIIASQSKAAGLPFWAFALASSHYDYPVPTLGELRLQLYSDLAYGAQGLQYFTYWTPNTEFQHGPIELDGKRSVVFDRLKTVNSEIQNLAGVFLGSKQVTVWHTGKLPAGTRRAQKLPAPVKVLETSDGGAVVSLLEKGSRKFLVIVNRDFQNVMKLTFVADETVKKVLKDGSLVPANKYAYTMDVEAGDAAIYTWE